MAEEDLQFHEYLGRDERPVQKRARKHNVSLLTTSNTLRAKEMAKLTVHTREPRSAFAIASKASSGRVPCYMMNMDGNHGHLDS